MKALRLIAAVLIVMLPFGLAVCEPEFISAQKCKMCHKVQYTSWIETPHAKAFEVLKPEEQGKAECLKCHATGDSAEMPGVQCEACHGAGSDFKSMKIMKDREAAVAAGLLTPDEELCLSCHASAPHDQKEFNYEEALKTGLHEFKTKE